MKNFKVTIQDVHCAIELLKQNTTPFNEESEKLANDILVKLDTQKIFKESLSGNDLEEKNYYAVAEIMFQIKNNETIII